MLIDEILEFCLFVRQTQSLQLYFTLPIKKKTISLGLYSSFRSIYSSALDVNKIVEWISDCTAVCADNISPNLAIPHQQIQFIPSVYCYLTNTNKTHTQYVRMECTFHAVRFVQIVYQLKRIYARCSWSPQLNYHIRSTSKKQWRRQYCTTYNNYYRCNQTQTVFGLGEMRSRCPVVRSRQCPWCNCEQFIARTDRCRSARNSM